MFTRQHAYGYLRPEDHPTQIRRRQRDLRLGVTPISNPLPLFFFLAIRMLLSDVAFQEGFAKPEFLAIRTRASPEPMPLFPAAEAQA